MIEDARHTPSTSEPHGRFRQPGNIFLDASMKNLIILGMCSLALGSSVSVFAQEAVPARGPEYKRLDTLLGKWKSVRTPAAAESEAVTSTRDCQWFPGGFQMVCNGESEGGDGKTRGLTIISYDPDRKAYSRYSISSFGGAAGDMVRGLRKRKYCLVDSVFR